MTQAVYAGQWLTRRVKLAPDDSIVRADNAFRLAAFGSLYSFGILTITLSRLIWTPTPYFWDFFPWTVLKTDIRKVSVSRLGFSFLPPRWCASVEARGRRRRFDFDGLVTGIRKPNAEEWVEEIGEWIAS